MEDRYHPGEKLIQERIGERLQAVSNGQVIVSSIVKGAINFIEKQPMAIVSSTDKNNRVWTSLLTGIHGFAKVIDLQTITFIRENITSDLEDPFFGNISENPFMGSLFIELDTRRRYRVNGSAYMDDRSITLQIAEAYPNCPKYIQQRVPSLIEAPVKNTIQRLSGTSFTPEIIKWIRGADTLFVGSQGANRYLDASHRGGPPGFAEIVDDHTIRIPDYSGNSMYNTFGNIVQNPKCGLLFVDFTNRGTLQLTGHAELLFNQNSKEDLAKTNGTGRFWLFRTHEWIASHNQHNLNWSFLSYSPFLPQE